MGLVAHITHGDILRHNVVHDGDSLHLIDFDEGVLSTSKLLVRTLDSKKQVPWFQALLYPHALRANGKLYTKVQLSAFVLLTTSNMELTIDLPRGKVKELIKLGEELQKNDAETWQKDGVPDDIHNMIDESFGYFLFSK